MIPTTQTKNRLPLDQAIRFAIRDRQRVAGNVFKKTGVEVSVHVLESFGFEFSIEIVAKDKRRVRQDFTNIVWREDFEKAYSELEDKAIAEFAPKKPVPGAAFAQSGMQGRPGRGAAYMLVQSIRKKREARS